MEQLCRHRRKAWVHLQQQQEAMKIGSDMIERAFPKPQALGRHGDLGDIGEPGSSLSRLAMAQKTNDRNSDSKGRSKQRKHGRFQKYLADKISGLGE